MEETYAGGTESRGSRMRRCLQSLDIHLSHESPNVSSCNVVTSSSASCWVVAGSLALELARSAQESGYFSSSLKGGRVFDAATEARGRERPGGTVWDSVPRQEPRGVSVAGRGVSEQRRNRSARRWAPQRRPSGRVQVPAREQAVGGNRGWRERSG